MSYFMARVVSSTDRRSFDVRLTSEGHGLVGDDVGDLLPVIDECVVRPLARYRRGARRSRARSRRHHTRCTQWRRRAGALSTPA